MHAGAGPPQARVPDPTSTAREARATRRIAYIARAQTPIAFAPCAMALTMFW
jgi:hypothetical protein